MKDTLVAVRRGPIDRLLVLGAAFGVMALSRGLVTPAWRRIVDPWVRAQPPGPRLLLGHLIVWTLPIAILSLLAITVLVRTGRFRPLSVRRDPGHAARDGALCATAIVALVVIYALAAGMPFALHINPWGIAGNFFSNAYEEVFYRGLIFTAAWYATGSVAVGALVSGAVFAYTHDQYPMMLRAITAVVGAMASYVYARTGNILAPWLAHQLADLILDAFL